MPLALAACGGSDPQGGDTTALAPVDTLEFECSYPGHYETGMKIPIVVE